MAGHSYRLSVVIPSFNGLHWLQRCIPRVLAYAPEGTEVIVVDDGSDDGTDRWLRNSGYPVRYIRRRQNGGFCAAVNDGLLAARAPVVETLNNDALVTPGWALVPLQLFQDPSIGAVAPLVLDLSRLSRIDSAGDAWHLCGRAYSRYNGMEVGDVVLRTEEVFGVSASAGFFRREAVRKAGFFPLEYGAYYDDVDLSFRLRYNGYRCVFCPESIVLHAVHGSYGGITPASLRRLARNEELTFWRNTPRAALPLAIPLHAVYAVVQGLKHVSRPRLVLASLTGRLDALLMWGEIQKRRSHISPRITVGDFRQSFLVDTSVRSFLRYLSGALRRRVRAGAPAPGTSTVAEAVRREAA